MLIFTVLPLVVRLPDLYRNRSLPSSCGNVPGERCWRALSCRAMSKRSHRMCTRARVMSPTHVPSGSCISTTSGALPVPALRAAVHSPVGWLLLGVRL